MASLIYETLTDLKALNTSLLPNYVPVILKEDFLGWYLLDKTSVENEALPFIVKPNNDIGRWYLLNTYSNFHQSVEELTADGPSTTLTFENAAGVHLILNTSTNVTLNIEGTKLCTLTISKQTNNITGWTGTINWGSYTPYTFPGSVVVVSISFTVLNGEIYISNINEHE